MSGPYPQKPPIYWGFMVPAERIELPTFGLQNRCSTAELCRHTWARGLYTAAIAF